MELEMKLTQNQVLSPQMELSVRILQMDSLRLVEYLKEVMLENPVIELVEPPQKDDRAQMALRKLEWLESQSRNEKENTGYYDEEEDLNLEKVAAAPDGESLVDHLLVQLRAADLPEELYRAARFLVGSLDGNGYLSGRLEELAQEAGMPLELLERGLAVVQGLDPTGVGARDLAECLCLQLGPQEELARKLACGGLEEIARNRLGQLARRLGEPLEQVQEAAERIDLAPA